MISQDLSHISIVPVNCTAKYWNRILCVNKSNEILYQESSNAKAKGQYKIYNSTLLGATSMCPSDYNIVIYGKCIKLSLIQDHMLQHNGTYSLNNVYNYRLCRNSKSYTEIASYPPLKAIEILEEFYAKGSKFFLGDQRINIDPDRYIWFAPPLYPTYMPCFAERRQIADEKIIQNLTVYTCEDGSVIPDALVCNGRSDCKNSEDETLCSICSADSLSTCFESCTFPNCQCYSFYYQCQRGGCVHYDHVCDSLVDCPDGDDESACQQKKIFYGFDKISIKKSYYVDLCDPPIGDMLMCRSNPQCYNSTAICHYDHSGGVMAHCEDGSHLGTGSLCRYIECPQQYKCSKSYCIPPRKVCDGIIDCPTGDDEISCAHYKCPGHMRCSGVSFCISPNEICDGIGHCPQHDDEKHCQRCSSGCKCKGTAIYCQDIKNLALVDDLQSPSALILHNSLEVFAELYNQHRSNMQYVWSVALRHGSLGTLLHTEINLLSKAFLSVKVLYLNHLGLHTIPPRFINAQYVTYFNLSHNAIHIVKRNAFALMQSVKILSLAYNKLQTLFSHFTSDLKCLSHFFLSGNQLVNIPADVFQENPGLVLV